MSRAAAVSQYLRENSGREYRLGEWDCTLFVFGFAERITGVDHFAEYRGGYTDYPEGVQLMKKLDRVATVRSLMGAKLGEPIPVGQALSGDVVAYGAIVGLMLAGRGIFLTEPSGFERIPLSRLERAWRIEGN